MTGYADAIAATRLLNGDVDIEALPGGEWLVTTSAGRHLRVDSVGLRHRAGYTIADAGADSYTARGTHCVSELPEWLPARIVEAGFVDFRVVDRNLAALVERYVVHAWRADGSCWRALLWADESNFLPALDDPDGGPVEPVVWELIA